MKFVYKSFCTQKDLFGILIDIQIIDMNEPTSLNLLVLSEMLVNCII